MQADNQEDLLGLLRQLRRKPIEPSSLTLERAAILKFLCDAHLVQRFERMAKDGASASPAAQS
jgi:hypothetical protein